MASQNGDRAKRATEAGIAELATCLEREQEAARRADAVEARHAAAAFHTEVIRLAGNELLQQFAAVTDSRMRWQLSQHDDLDAMLAEHRALHDAVAAGDAALAARLARRHVRASRRTAIAKLRAAEE